MSTPQNPDPRGRETGPHASSTAIDDTDPERPERPSLRQMTASALTAVSATALLSYLGMWGTVLGMGLLSVLTVLGNYMYSTSIQRTTERVKQVRPVVARPRGRSTAAGTGEQTQDDREAVTASQVSWTVGSAADNDTHPTEDAQDDPRPDGDEAGDDDRLVGRWRAIWHSMVERYGTRRIVLSMIAVFVLLAGTITVIELAAGKPMTDIVRNESGSGTSVLGGNGSDGSGADSDGSSNPDGGSEQQDPQDSNPQDGQPTDEPPDGQPTDDSQDDQPTDQPTEEPTEEPSAEEPPAEEPPADEPPAEQPAPDDGGTAP